MRLVLGNAGYGSLAEAHMTDEGSQFQWGLVYAGWEITGAGFLDGCRSVPELLRRYQPEAVVVSDKRDWDPNNAGCFNKQVGFTDLSCLREHPRIFRAGIVKDAGSMISYHQAFLEEMGADAAIIYYHPKSVLAVSPWLKKYRLLRIYHTVDSALLRTIPLEGKRKRAMVSGALSATYPLRTRVVQSAGQLGIDVIKHPGYSNHGCHTPGYLQMLAGYKVHVATASRYGFALRKLMESVAVGTIPITDLPEYDVLPGIDLALVRIPSGVGVSQIRAVIDQAERSWDLEERRHYAKIAQELYDFRRMGRGLSEEISTCLRSRDRN